MDIKNSSRAGHTRAYLMPRKNTIGSHRSSRGSLSQLTSRVCTWYVLAAGIIAVNCSPPPTHPHMKIINNDDETPKPEEEDSSGKHGPSDGVEEEGDDSEKAEGNSLLYIGSLAGPTPKGFPRGATHFVKREEQLTHLENVLEAAADDEGNPGVYMAGPAGAGKSILAYILVHTFRSKGWLVVYTADCRGWVREDKTLAKGYFLDRVREALKAGQMKDRFENLSKLLDEPPANVDFPAAAGEEWISAARQEEHKKKIEKAYSSVIVVFGNPSAKVLLVFDEVNALWKTTDGKSFVSFTEDPWVLTRFQPPFMQKNGAVLITGTTDNDFITQRVPHGLEKHIFYVGRCNNGEIEAMRSLKMYEVLRQIAQLDSHRWQSISEAAGNIPRELKYFVDQAERSKLLKRVHDFLSEDNQPPTKRRKETKEEVLQAVDNSIIEWRRTNQQRQKVMLDHALEAKGSDSLFEEALFEACEDIFLRGKPTEKRDLVLRVPNFVVNGLEMQPTTVDAQKMYFEWFCKSEQRRKRDFSVATMLQEFVAAGVGGDRGNKFEAYLAAKLTVLGGGAPSPVFMFHKLAYQETPRKISLPLPVRERVFRSKHCPPTNFQHFGENTLLTHTDPDGGSERIDIIHYRTNRVIFIEATVGNYRDEKIPTKDGEELETLILDSIKKWLGEKVFEVKVVPVDAHGKLQVGAPKELKVTYRGDSHKSRPAPPEVHYVVATTCPLGIVPERPRIGKYNWIKVCFLEDLIEAGIIPDSYKDQILETQAKGAK